MRTRLNRSIIVNAALDLADEDGLDKVTMRRLAQRLGAAPMSLYRHVASKAELHDAMLDRVVQRLVPYEAAGVAWPVAVREIARKARRTLVAHPSWLPLFTRKVAPTSAMSMFEGIAAAMLKDRVSPQRRLDSIAALMCFTLGFVLVERMMQTADGVVPLAQLRAAHERTSASPRAYPRLAMLASGLERWSFDKAFEDGLETLLAGIATPPRSRGVATGSTPG